MTAPLIDPSNYLQHLHGLEPNIDPQGFEALYKESLDDNEGFWASQAQRLDWMTPFTKTKDVSFDKNDLHIKWFEDGELNVCVNCVDRHLEKRADQPAIIWEGDEPSVSKTITYQELHEEVCRLANAYEALGVGKGDRVILYIAPTAIRTLMASAEESVAKSKRTILRILGSVGEPINPEVWRWYHTVFGNGKCPIVDTWWQIETGGLLWLSIVVSIYGYDGNRKAPYGTPRYYGKFAAR